MKYIILILLAGYLLSCTDSNSETNGEKATSIENKAANSDLIELKGDLYTEYYPGGKVVKFTGRLDEKGKRMGLWTSYLLNGKELSQSEYLHDVLHGIMIVKHPNGAIYYSGEFKNGAKIGSWTYRNEDGSINYVKDYDTEN